MDLAAMFRNLPTNSKRLLVAAGGLLAAVLVLRGRNRPEPEPATEPTPAIVGTAPVTFDTSAIGTGELMAWQDSVAEELASLAENVDTLVNRPQGTSSTPGTQPGRQPRQILHTYAVEGDTVATVATRLRKQGNKTADGRDLTTNYLIRLNQWKGKSSTSKLWPGQIIAY